MVGHHLRTQLTFLASMGLACSSTPSGSNAPTTPASADASAATSSGAVEAAPPRVVSEALLTDPPSGPFTGDVIDVATRFGDACALTSKGKVACWGLSWTRDEARYLEGVDDAVAVALSIDGVLVTHRSGEVTIEGESTTIIASIPAQRVDRTVTHTPVSIGTPIAEAKEGDSHHLVVRAKDGRVFDWTDDGKSKAIPGVKGAVAIEAAGDSACALLEDGSVTCWGGNGSGQLGRPAAPGPLPPAAVPGVKDATGISMGGGACALLRSGKVMCWGGGPKDAGPALVPGIDDGRSVAVGREATCVVRASALTCWGRDDPLFVAPFQDRERGGGPRSLARTDLARASMSEFGCAVTTAGGVVCFGALERFGATRVYGLPKAIDVIAHTSQTCAVVEGGDVHCWGSRDSRDGKVHASELRGVTRMSSAFCGLFGGGKVSCGLGSSATVALDADAISVQSGTNHTCSALGAGTVACWGDDYDGVLLGGAKSEDSARAVEVPGLMGVVSVGVGKDATCAARKDGSVVCWGKGEHGELGDGASTAGRAEPKPVPGISGAVEVSVGDDVACARLGSGKVKCWGSTEAYVATDPDESNDTKHTHTPSTAPVDDATSISVGGHQGFTSFACATLTSGAVKCWGTVGFRPGITLPDEHDQLIAGVADAVQVSVGTEHACARTRGGEVLCWGVDAQGETGGRSGGLVFPIKLP